MTWGRPERRGAGPARAQSRGVLAGVPAPGRRGPPRPSPTPWSATWSGRRHAGDPITDHEIASVCYGLLFAGHETTTTLIANALRVLLAHPDQWDQVVADPGTDPGCGRRGAAVQPLDRRLAPPGEAATPSSAASRPRGANVLLLMGSANRDEARFADPEHLRHRPRQRPRAPGLRLRHPLLPRQHAGQAPDAGRPSRKSRACARPAAGRRRRHHLRPTTCSFRAPVARSRDVGTLTCRPPTSCSSTTAPGRASTSSAASAPRWSP